MLGRLALLSTCAALVAASAAQCQEQLRTLVCEADGSEMVLIPAGEFTMGSGERFNETPAHGVRVDAFYLDRHEVTNRQFKLFVDANPEWAPDRIAPRLADRNYLAHWEGDTYPPELAEYPVVNVSWYAAAAYVQWAGKRLPSEAQWEWAARGPQGHRYSWGDEFDPQRGNVARRADGPMPVCSFPSNDFGLCDMTGNVLEWCADWYDEEYYAESPVHNPTGPDSGDAHVLRGGAWLSDTTRSLTTFRFPVLPPGLDRTCADFVGFRGAMDVPPGSGVTQ